MSRLKANSVQILLAVLLTLCLLWKLAESGIATMNDDPGLGWHLKTGELILSSGTIPRVDPFLAGEVSRQWIADQWGGDVILELLYRIGSWSFLSASLGALFFVSFFVVGTTTAQLRGPSLFLSVLGAFFTYRLGEVHCITRPVVFGVFLFALQGLLWALVEKRGSHRSTSFVLFSGTLLYVVWSNLHPSFVLGLAYLGLTSLGLLLEGYFDPSSKYTKEIRTLSLLFVVSSIGTLCNPYFLSLHQSIFTLGQSDFFMTLNEEWHGVEWGSPEGFALKVVLGICFLGLFLRLKRGKRLRWSELLPVFFLLYGSIQSVRFLPFLAIVLHPILSESFEGLGKRFQKRSTLKGREGGELLRKYLVLTGAGVLIFLSAAPFFPPNPPAEERYPYGALNFLLDKSGSATVLASPNYGGFFTFFGEGRVRSLLDDRNTLLGEEPYRKYLRLVSGRAGISEGKRYFPADYILLSRESKLLEGLSAGSLPVYSDELFVLFGWGAEGDGGSEDF